MFVLQKHRRAAAKAVLESPLDRTDADRAKSARSAEKILAGRSIQNLHDNWTRAARLTALYR